MSGHRDSLTRHCKDTIFITGIIDMEHFIKRLVVVTFLLATTASTAMADNQFIRTRLSVVAQSTDDNVANWINTVVQPLSTCNYGLYMPYTDKEMFAVALTAQAAKLEVEVYYDSTAPSKTMPGYGIASTCKIKSINMKYVQ